MIELSDFFTIANMEWLDEYQNDESESRALQFRQRTQTGQRFEFFLTSEPLDLRELSYTMGKLNAIRQAGDFNVRIPALSFTGVANKTLSASIAIGDIDATLSNSGGLEVGQYFKFNNHSKVYQVTEVNGSTITFWPNAVRDVSSAQAVIFDAVPFTVRLRGRIQRYNISGRDNFGSIRINCVESF